MKPQTKTNLLFVLILFFVIVTNYALLGFVDFNYYGQNLSEPIHFILRYCGIGIVNLIYFIAFKKISSSWATKEELEDAQTKKKYKKKNLIYLLMIVFVNAAFIILYTIHVQKYVIYGHQIELLGLKWSASLAPSNDTLDSLKEAEEVAEQSKHVSWRELGISLLVILANLIPVGLVVIFNRFRRYSRENASIFKKLFHGVINVVVTIFLLSFVCLCVYEYVNIPEFRYQGYGTIHDVDTGKEYFVVKGGLVDSRDWYDSRQVRVPEKIWGKKVDAISEFDVLPETTYILPSSMDWETHDVAVEKENFQGNKYTSNISWFSPALPINSTIVMEDEPKTWYVKNNTLYNIENTEMDVTFLLMTDHVNLWVPKTIDKEYMKEKTYMWPIFILSSSVDSITMEDGNPFLYAKQNALVNYSENDSGERWAMVFPPINQTMVKVDEKDPEYVTISRMCYTGFTVEIGKEVKDVKEIYYQGAGAISQIILDEENDNYVLYDNCLYTNDFSKLVCIANHQKYIENGEIIPARTSIKLPDAFIANLENLDDSNYSLDTYDIELEENSNYLYEKGILYNHEKTRVYLISDSALVENENSYKTYIELPETVEWVNPSVIHDRAYSSYSFSGDSVYTLLNYHDSYTDDEGFTSIISLIRLWNEIHPDRMIAYEGPDPSNINSEIPDRYYRVTVDCDEVSGSIAKVSIRLVED